jgi:methionyl-tRNA synthetase
MIATTTRPTARDHARLSHCKQCSRILTPAEVDRAVCQPCVDAAARWIRANAPEWESEATNG